MIKIKNYQVPEKRKLLSDKMRSKRGKIKMSQRGTWQYQKHFYSVHIPTAASLLSSVSSQNPFSLDN
jgi:DNA-directed RNA polymerase subunit F